MNFIDRLTEDIKAAMKARESLKLEALRGVKKELLEARSVKGASHELDDADVLKIIQKMVKQRKDAAEIFNGQNRADLAEKELAEAEIISVYLPEAMSQEELDKIVADIIARLGVTSVKEMGKVMGVASKELAGKADGKAISDTVKKILNS